MSADRPEPTPPIRNRASLRRPALKWVAVVASVICAGLSLGWLGLNYQPEFYTRLRPAPSQRRHESAQQFLSQTLQLRNDIVNEPSWQARFSDEQVNAWLAEDLVESFADLIPAGFSDPRVLFELDRVTLACHYQDGALRSVLWAILRLDVPRDNEVSITIEKIQAGAFPLPADQFLDRLTEHARVRGLDITWTEDHGLRVATIRYAADPSRRDIVLERVQVTPGWVLLTGRSNPASAVAVKPSLPSRHVIQSKFRIQQRQSDSPSPPDIKPPGASTRSSITPRNT